ERHHPHPNRLHTQLVAARQELVVDHEPGRPVDEVDEELLVERLDEPPFGWDLRPKAELLECAMSVLDIVLADEEVDVVLGRWATSRPGAETTAECVRDVSVSEGGGDPLETIEQVLGERVR